MTRTMKWLTLALLAVGPGGPAASWAAGTLTPTVTVTTNPNPSTFNEAVKVNATVTGSAGTPTGRVVFHHNGIAIPPNCGGNPVNGTYTCVLTLKFIGTHDFLVHYEGDATYQAADSPVTRHIVGGKYPAKTGISAASEDSAVGEAFTLFATIAKSQDVPAEAPAPTGHVTFSTAEGAPIEGCSNLPVSQPTLQCNPVPQTTGTHVYKVVYSGDIRYDASSATIVHEVTGANTASMAVAADPKHGMLNQPVTLTATVSGTAGVPTGTVKFSSLMSWNGAIIYVPVPGCENTPYVNGVAQCAVKAIAAGRYEYRVTYSGDSTYRSAFATLRVPFGAAEQKSDLNGDGRSDVAWYHAGNFALAGMSALAGPAGGLGQRYPIDSQSSADWYVAGIGNLNGYDGSDVVWRNAATGELYGLLFLGTTVIDEGTFYTEPNLQWKPEQFVDLDDDGRTEIVWRNGATGEVYAMRMNALSVLEGRMIYAEPNLDWRIVATGDMNGDGRGDLLWRNAATGDVFALLMDGFNVIGGGVIYSEPDPAWQIVGLADFDGDMKADLLWRNTVTGDVFQMRMNGTAISAGQVIYGEPDLQWRIAALGDYNGDGRTDILWRHDATGHVYMMRMDGFAILSGDFVYTEPDAAWRILGP